MGCAVIGDMFFCGDGVKPCGECTTIADCLCDWPMGAGKTCDALLCDRHAHPIGDDRHLCPIHAAVFQATGAMTPIRVDRLSVTKGGA